jgi:hypothetical protein
MHCICQVDLVTAPQGLGLECASNFRLQQTGWSPGQFWWNEIQIELLEFRFCRNSAGWSKTGAMFIKFQNARL